MKNLTTKMRQKIAKNTIRVQVTHRGGGIEIDLSAWGFRRDARMSAYQNYLGGGMLGSIQTNHNMFRTSFTTTETKKLERLSTQLAMYFHELSNHSEDEWESATFEETQMRSASAY
jgi:hypothetical protein